MGDEWIIVPNWERFQSRNLTRRPTWIRNYPGALLHKSEYLDLGLAERGLLHGIWLAYSESNGRLRRRDLTHMLSCGSTRALHIDSLLRKGFIELSTASPSPLYIDIDLDARAEVRTDVPEGEDQRLARRRRAAETWILSGASAEVPLLHLPEMLAKDFKLEGHPEIVSDLVVRAMEMRS